MPIWISAPFVTFAALGFVFSIRAGRHMAPHVTDPFLEFNLRRGLFAGRDHFTERGWRYRNLALRCHAVAAVTLFVWIVWSLVVG